MNYCNLIIFKTFTQLSCDTWFWFTMIHDFVFLPPTGTLVICHITRTPVLPAGCFHPPTPWVRRWVAYLFFCEGFFGAFFWLCLEDFFKDKTNLHQKSLPTNLGGVKKRSRFPKLLNFKMGGGPFPKGMKFRPVSFQRGMQFRQCFF